MTSPLAPASPRTAVVWSVLAAELDRRGAPVDVLDVGGGTGGFAVPLARAGHDVTVVDPSPDALAALTRRAAETGVGGDRGAARRMGRVRGYQGDADTIADLVEPASADLVLCHAVLEVVDDPAAVLVAIVRALRPDGVVSLLVANRAASVLSRAVTGHFAAAQALLDDPPGAAGGRDPVRRRFDAASASALLTVAGLAVEQVHGVRVFADLVPGAVADSDSHALVDLELAVAARAPYRDIATQLHLFARRA